MQTKKQNPRVKTNPWGEIYVQFDHPTRADFVWLGDRFYSNFGGGVGLVKLRDPHCYPSVEAAEAAVRNEILPYIREWKSGWEQWITGW